MIKDATLQNALTFLFRNTSGHTSRDKNLFLFSQEHHTFFGQPISLATTEVGRCQGLGHNLSEKVEMACRSIIHGAQGLAVGVLTPIPLWLGLGQPRSGVRSTRRRRAARPTCSESRARSQDRFEDQARSWSVRI